jgi:hypothetical protein
MMWSEEFERRAAEMRERNERDRLAFQVGHDHLRIADAVSVSGAMERHYRVKELAALWRLSRDSIARIFGDEPGVPKIGTVKPRRGHRSHISSLRIPESVAQTSPRALGRSLGSTAGQTPLILS